LVDGPSAPILSERGKVWSPGGNKRGSGRGFLFWFNLGNARPQKKTGKPLEGTDRKPSRRVPRRARNPQHLRPIVTRQHNTTCNFTDLPCYDYIAQDARQGNTLEGDALQTCRRKKPAAPRRGYMGTKFRTAFVFGRIFAANRIGKYVRTQDRRQFKEWGNTCRRLGFEPFYDVHGRDHEGADGGSGGPGSDAERTRGRLRLWFSLIPNKNGQPFNLSSECISSRRTTNIRPRSSPRMSGGRPVLFWVRLEPRRPASSRFFSKADGFIYLFY